MTSPAHQPHTSPSTTGSDLAAVTVASCLPDFWTEQPRHWFFQIEAILNPQKLCDQAKYDLVIGKLSKDAIGQITDLLIQPPSTDKYNALKERLLSIYEESATRQLQKLLSEMELGDQKPSQLLRCMRDLARGKIPDHTLSIAEVSHGDGPSTSTILAEIAKLSARIASIEQRQTQQHSFTTCQCGSRGRSMARDGSVRRRRPTSRDSNGRTPASSDWLCTYHYRYKEKARKCNPACSAGCGGSLRDSAIPPLVRHRFKDRTAIPH